MKRPLSAPRRVSDTHFSTATRAFARNAFELVALALFVAAIFVWASVAERAVLLMRGAW